MELPDRPQTRPEELANAASHGLGLLLALGSLPLLTDFAARQGSAKLIGVGVFSATMILLYFTSALYHALPQGPAKRWCQACDHAAIYLFIAGSYTPFLLGVMPAVWGRPLLGVVWTLALVGVLLKLMTRRLENLLLSTALYVAMGWLVLVAIGPLVNSISGAGLAWLLAGAVAYMAGLVFFLLDARLRFGHFVWHLFVLTGSACHFVAALWHSH